MHFVSKTCAGAWCACGRPATHKIGEESYPDHPASHPDPIVNAAELAVLRSMPAELQDGHNLTAYVCCEHFRKLMGSAAPCGGVEEKSGSYTPAGLRAYFEPDDTEEDHGELRKMLVWAADEIERLDGAGASRRDRIAELSDELADVQADNADLTKRRDELLALVANLSQTVPLESEVNEALGQRGMLLAEIGTLRAEIEELRENLRAAEGDVLLGLERLEDLQQRLRIAEVVRDDARAASARDLAARRAIGEPAMYVRMTSDRLEAVAKSELRILAEFAAQEIKERDDKIVAIALVLGGDHDDASAMVEEIRKIIAEKRVHVECVNMPGGTGPCACLDGCGSCDSCGHWLGDTAEEPQAPKPVTYKGMVVPPGYSATFHESDGSVTTICATGPSSGSSSSPSGYRAYPAWSRPGASSTEIRDSIIAAVGMMADARTPEMQAAYDAALARESKIDSPDGPTGVANHPVSSDRVEGWKKGVLESIDKLTAFQMNGNSLTYEKALELLNTLYHHPPTLSTTVITREQLVQDKGYETWVPSAADGAIIGEPLAMRLPVVDPSRAPEVIEKPRAEGDHYFEDWCNACGAGQPSGECSVCPHLPVGYGPGGYGAIDTNAEHYARRPCQSCGSTDLRSVRVREPTK